MRKKKNENNANDNNETSIEMKTKEQMKIKEKGKDETEYVSISKLDISGSSEWFMVGKSNISPSIYSQMSHIDASELKFEKVIGNGSFGQVWKGNWRGLIVAIKQVKQNTIDEKSKIFKFICKSLFFNFQFFLIQFFTFKTHFKINK